MQLIGQYPGVRPSMGKGAPTVAISVVIPLYNGGRFIEEALRSVFSQTRKADEVIVVDDGSTDDGPSIVQRLAKEFPIHLVSQANAGQSAARNAGVELAKGDLIAFLDQDDIWYRNHLEELSKPFLEERSIELAWSYSDLDEIDENGCMVTRNTLVHHRQSHPKRDLNTCLSRDMFILPSASLVSRRAFRQVGGFDERLSGYEDDDLFLRLFRAGFDNVFLPQSLSKWRIYPTSSSYSVRMAASRVLYARMLIQRFPDDVERSRHFVQDLIAPRFLRAIVFDLRRCTLARNEPQRRQALEHLSFMVGYLRLSFRVPFRILVLPALRIPPLARVLMRYHAPVSRIVSRML